MVEALLGAGQSGLRHLGEGEERHLLVIQQTKTELVMELAHSQPMAGHLRAANNLQQLWDHFHCPGMDAEVRRFCQCCPVCQRTAPQRPLPSPLIPMAIIEVPFERIGMDLVGPFPKSNRGHEHILVIVNYATRYPEAVPLRKTSKHCPGTRLTLQSSRHFQRDFDGPRYLFCFPADERPLSTSEDPAASLKQTITAPRVLTGRQGCSSTS